MLVIVIVLAALSSGAGHAQQTESADIDNFFHALVGEWIGTLEQSTDQVKASTKYFHVLATQTSPNSYETVFEYYKLDPKTREPMDAGTSRMVTRIAPDGTVTNAITGDGDVLIDAKTLRPAQHQLSEIAQMSSPNVLLGSGTGSIKVGSAQSGSGSGKNG